MSKKASPQSTVFDIGVPKNPARTTMSVVMRKDELHKIQCVAALRGFTVSQLVRKVLFEQKLLEKLDSDHK